VQQQQLGLGDRLRAFDLVGNRGNRRPDPARALDRIDRDGSLRQSADVVHAKISAG
jgi:hypothetical protein